MSTFINFNIYKKTFKPKNRKKLEKNIEKKLKEQHLINKIIKYWQEPIELSYTASPPKEMSNNLIGSSDSNPYPYDPPNHGRTYVTSQLEGYLSDDD